MFLHKLPNHVFNVISTILYLTQSLIINERENTRDFEEDRLSKNNFMWEKATWNLIICILLARRMKLPFKGCYVVLFSFLP